MGMDVYGLEPTGRSGEYFRASIWHWRPLLSIIVEANDRYRLGIDRETLEGMSMNCGSGLKTQSECNDLADAIHRLLLDPDSLLLNRGLVKTPEGYEVPEVGYIKGTGLYSVSLDAIDDFCCFLYSCGGFEVR